MGVFGTPFFKLGRNSETAHHEKLGPDGARGMHRCAFDFKDVILDSMSQGNFGFNPGHLSENGPINQSLT